jgi:hypothetical protein
MSKKRVYKIIVYGGWIFKLLQELKAWGVADEKYQVDLDSDTIITTDKNVIDVATETFILNLHLISIESIPTKPSYDKPEDDYAIPSYN